jgi:transcriptional regulator with XRE-family HTH domain
MIPMDRKSPIDTHIGQHLKEYRQHRAMTVRELADAAHVTPGQISRYEHGRDRISHERVTEFARILRIKSNDLYQPPGSRLRRNHVRWRLTNFMAAVIAEAAALMSSRRQAAADEATMVAAVAVAVGASAAAASDAGAGEKSSLTTSADDTAVHIDASDAANALLIMDGANTNTIILPGHYTINATESQGGGGKYGAANEDDWNRYGGGLGRERRCRSAGRCDHGQLTLDKLRRLAMSLTWYLVLIVPSR